MTQAPTQQPQDLASSFFSQQALAQAPIPQADQERKQEMAEAWKSYKGRLQDPLKVGKDQPNDNVKSNRCAPIVDKGVSFLFGQVLKIEATDEVPEKDEIPDLSDPTAPTKDKKPSPQQEYIDGMWGDDDDKMTRLSKKAMNGGVCGQVFVKLIPAQGGMKYPRIVNLDPRNVRIVTDPEDCDLHLAYIIEYPAANDWQKRQIIARVDPNGSLETWGNDDLDDTWTITNYVRKGQTGVWMQVGTPEEWPYPFAPIFTCQNLPNPNEAWGIPDLTYDLIQLNKALNFVQSNTSRIIKFHGHPKTWAKGIKAGQMSIAVDDVIVLESLDATLQNLEMKSDLASSLNFIAVLRDNMDEQSRVPSVALGRLESLPRGNISGVALQLLFQPLIEKTVLKQRLYGRLIREVSRAALVLAGLIEVSQYEDYKISLHFQNLLPVDDLMAAQVAQKLLTIGVSESTVLAGLGYDAVEEAKKKMQEDEVKMKQAQSMASMMGQQPQPGQQFPPPAPGQPAGAQQPASGGQK
jgi:hypothetical protein